MRPTTAIVLCCAILALLGGFLFASRGAGANNRRYSYWDDEVEAHVRYKVATTYVDEVDAQRAQEAFYRAMNEYVRFDRYCEFIPPDKYRAWREDTSGRYAGVGVKILVVEEGLLIKGVWPGGPADQGGIQIGDTIVRVAGQYLAGKTVDEITPLLKGPAGTQVAVAVVRGPRPEDGPATGERRKVVLTRALIRPPTVFIRRVGPDGTFGVIRMTDFAQESSEAFDEALTEMLRDGVTGLVLDLRHNGGGVLGVATDVVDRFLAEGVIVRMEGRSRDARRPTIARQQDTDVLHLKLVVLVDGRSASASEVVAGALQDHRRAVVVGTRTYGKFLVQSITEVPRRGAALKLTTARYYLPSGRSYQAPLDTVDPVTGANEPAGLLPDVAVDLSDEQALDVYQQWSNAEGRFWGEPNEYDVADDWIDPQLAKALQVLRGEVTFQPIKSGATTGSG